MIVKRAAVLGRCMGVRRALELAEKTADEEALPGGAGRPVYTLGPLIHNPRTVAALEARGIKALSDADLEEGLAEGRASRFASSVIVIRAHGVPPLLRSRLEAAGAKIVDATCPRVIASQRRAKDYAGRGWTVVIAGDRDHGEVVGIAGWAPGARIVQDPEEAARLLPSLLAAGKPVALIAQTTIKEEEYHAIRMILEAGLPGLEIVHSICPCTGERLEALSELALDCEALVVVGGRNSANTMRLFATAAETGLPSWLVEGASELPAAAFGYKVVGVTAGASTPDEAIAEVEEALLAGAAG